MLMTVGVSLIGWATTQEEFNESETVLLFPISVRSGALVSVLPLLCVLLPLVLGVLPVMCKPSENIWSVGIAALVAGVFVCCWVTAPPTLPVPPDLTVAEMRQREDDFLAWHLETCKVCNTERDDPVHGRVVAYCDDGLRVLARAQVIGDWAVVTQGPARLFWQYVGRPIPGWRWNVIRQSWIKRGNNAE